MGDVASRGSEFIRRTVDIESFPAGIIPWNMEVYL